MRTRLRPMLVAGLLAAPFLGQSVAAAEPRDLTGPSLPTTASATASARASDALARAQALFAEKGPVAARRQAAQRPDATMALNALMRAYVDLSAADRKAADRLLARPTKPGGDGTVEYQAVEATPVCSGASATPICVHYVTTTDDAPSLTDTTPANGIPDEVDRALATAESVHGTYVGSGYRRPDSDGSRGGGSGTIDIYLAQLGDQGLYGYCTSDQPIKDDGTFNYWAYCVIDNDFSAAEFPTNTPTENQQVTLAHEYFHAVQFAYDAFEDLWVMEATATWAEEQLYDGIDDNRQYLGASQIALPYVPLDVFSGAGGYQYGNWIFFQYLTERWPAKTGSMPTLVLDLWKRLQNRSASDPDRYSTQAVQDVLAARNASFTGVYGQFADGNRRPAKTYTEGSAREYAPSKPAATRKLSSAKRSTPKWKAQIDHLTSLSVRLKPHSGLTKQNWKLRVKVDLPAKGAAPVARLAVYKKNGKVSSSTVAFKKKGFSRKVVGFSAKNVRYVELTLVNASRRSNCWSDFNSPFACLGTPRDDGKRFDFNASIYRR